MAEERETGAENEALLRTAAQWFVCVHEDASMEDIASWQAWMDQSPSHRDAFRRIEEMWEITRGGVSPPGQQTLEADRYDGEVSLFTWLRERLVRRAK